MKALGIVLVALVAASCSSSEPAPRERFLAPGDGFSMVPPAGWSQTRERGDVVFVSDASPRRTLVVRTRPVKDDAARRKAPQATRTVLAALPGAAIAGQRDVRAALPGTAFELTFIPPGSGERFARRHVVLVGARRIFHVIETRPAVDAASPPVLDEVIASFREEA